MLRGSSDVTALLKLIGNRQCFHIYLLSNCFCTAVVTRVYYDAVAQLTYRKMNKFAGSWSAMLLILVVMTTVVSATPTSRRLLTLPDDAEQFAALQDKVNNYRRCLAIEN